MSLIVAAPTQAAPKASEVRFVHAVPGVGEAAFAVSGSAVGSAAFGEATDYAGVPAGRARLELSPPGGGKPLTAPANLSPGESYTVVAMAQGKSAKLLLFEDDGAIPGKARLRIIHAAADLGRPDLALGGRTIAERVKYESATRYWTLDPGAYRFAVEDPADGKPVIAPQSLSLSAGSGTTALVIGGMGERLRTVLLSDRLAAPQSAPETGFGGLADVGDRPLGPALGAAAGAAVLGGLGFWLATARGRRRRERGAA